MSAVFAALVLLPGLAACGSDDRADEPGSSAVGQVAEDGALPGIRVTGKFGEEPSVDVEAPLEVEETSTQVLTKGTGPNVTQGMTASLNLQLVNGSTGKKAIGTYESGKPVAAPMVEGQIFQAVLDAVVGKPAGSRIVVAAAPEDAFGEAGAQQYGVGPEDPVVFVIDIMSVPLSGPEGTEVPLPDGAPTIVEDETGGVTRLDFKGAGEPAKQLQVIPVIEGSGEPVEAGDSVTFDYLGQIYGSNTIFDESYSSAARTFTVGDGGLIKAWDEGLVGVKAGSRVLIIAPPKYGYGEAGNPQAGIKGTDTLAFVVDVLGVG